MGDYVDLTKLNAKYGTKKIIDLSDLDGDGNVDTDVVDKAISAAESKINSYVITRYTIASVITAQPPVILDTALSLTLYNLAEGRDPNYVIEDSEYDTIYKREIAWLEGIARGDIDLDVTDVTEQTVVDIDSDTRVFNETTFKGY